MVVKPPATEAATASLRRRPLLRPAPKCQGRNCKGLEAAAEGGDHGCRAGTEEHAVAHVVVPAACTHRAITSGSEKKRKRVRTRPQARVSTPFRLFRMGAFIYQACGSASYQCYNSNLSNISSPTHTPLL